MSATKVEVADPFVGLERAENRLPARWVAIEERLLHRAMTAVLVAVQLAWVMTLAYFAYRFVSS
jgi:hypothetical protein